ncbi:MAG: GNAT family N-acetyltransferase [Micavibrio sp.]|nr:GNAT family N-acetyltransferase [Micavibrio sp.]
MVRVRPLDSNDFPNWLPLWDANNLGTRNEAVTSETWTRLNDPASKVCGIVAEKNGALVGLVHYVLHPTTGAINDVCYMQDVYVDEAHRGKGIARKMVQALAAEGRKQKWARLYWLAESKNEAAAALYKNLGVKLDFDLYMMGL